jgi:hypothetical protein
LSVRPRMKAIGHLTWARANDPDQMLLGGHDGQ